MLSIGTNMGSSYAKAAASSAAKGMDVAMERLATGKRINAAKDDAAGVAIASRMASKVHGLSQSIRNSMDAQGLISTAEGGFKETESILQRIRELAIQASNDTNSSADRNNLDNEAQQLIASIDAIASGTTWAGQNLLDGTFSNKAFLIGTGDTTADTLNVSINSATSSDLGFGLTPATASISQVGGELQSVEILAGQNVTIGETTISLNTQTVNYGDEVQPLLLVNGNYTTALADSVRIDSITLTSGGEARLFTLGTNLNGFYIRNRERIAFVQPTMANYDKLSYGVGRVRFDTYDSGEYNVNFDLSSYNSPFDPYSAYLHILTTLQSDATLHELGYSFTPAGSSSFEILVSRSAVPTVNTVLLEAKSNGENQISTNINGITITTDISSVGDNDFLMAANLVAQDINANNDLSLLGYSAVSDSNDPGKVDIFRSNTPVVSSVELYDVVSFDLSGVNVSVDLSSLKTDFLAGRAAVVSEINSNKNLLEMGYSAKIDIINPLNIIVSRANTPIITVASNEVPAVPAISLTSRENAQQTLSRVDIALDTVNSQRAYLGSLTNRLEHAIFNNTNAVINVQGSMSRIQDADYASAASDLAKWQILESSSTAMLAQANASMFEVLVLIRD